MNNSKLHGLALTAVGVQFNVFANCIMKSVGNVPVIQLIQIRFLIQWVCTLGISIALRLLGKSNHFFGKPGNQRILLLRAICYAVALMSMWMALDLLPLGDLTVIVKLNPLICGILASCFLSEPLGWNFWGQAGISFAGILFVTGANFSESSTESYQQGAMLALLSAFGFAAMNICAAAVKRDAKPTEIQFYSDTAMAFVIAPVSLLLSADVFDWSSVNFNVLIRVAVATGFGLSNLLLTTWGLQLAPASTVSLFSFLEVPGAFAVQILALGEVLDYQKLFGSLLVVVAAAYIFWREASASRTEGEKYLLHEAEMESMTNESGQPLLGA